jgi:hypothetical protein
MLREDYITRMIKEIVRVIVKLVTNKDIIREDLVNPVMYPNTYDKYRQLIEMADHNKINEAENMLSEIIDMDDQSTLEAAMAFYLHINDYEDEYLEKCDYTREEIRDGILDVSKKFGVNLDSNLFL